jgi:hypothetical protein
MSPGASSIKLSLLYCNKLECLPLSCTFHPYIISASKAMSLTCSSVGTPHSQSLLANIRHGGGGIDNFKHSSLLRCG